MKSPHPTSAIKHLGRLFAFGLGASLLLLPLNPPAAIGKSKNSTVAEKIYAKARAQLPEHLYPSYRLLDRLMSANPAITQTISIAIRSIDDTSCMQVINNPDLCEVLAGLPDIKKEDNFLIWALQVAGAAQGQINAYAISSRNSIIINKSLYNAFAGDVEAQACVIAHEIAHVQEDHTKQSRKALSEWNKEAAIKMNAAIQNAHLAQKKSQILPSLTMIINTISAGLSAAQGDNATAESTLKENEILASQLQAEVAAGNTMIPIVIRNAQVQSPEVYNAFMNMKGLSPKLIDRTMQDIGQYLAEVNEKFFALSRSHELEADHLAVKYMSQAGLNPQACIRVIEKLNRGHHNPFASKNDTHPGEVERVENIKAAIAIHAPALKNAKSKPSKPAPLSYHYDNRTETVIVHARGQQMVTGVPDTTKNVDSILD